MHIILIAVPEIEQKALPELRSAYQAVYYIHKLTHTLSARLHIEDRHIKNDSGTSQAGIEGGW